MPAFYGQGIHVGAVPHDGNFVADASYLIEPMADKYNCHSPGFKNVHGFEQPVDFLFGQHRRRFIRNKNLAVRGDSPGNLYHDVRAAGLLKGLISRQGAAVPRGEHGVKVHIAVHQVFDAPEG
ncbi:MAG: hypothetical protein LBE10_02660, partial [Treponema sp.]|nr:hypothetical protein [Treponema sp.]